MTVSPFDHPLLAGLLGEAEAAACFSLDAELAAMLRFEAALAEAEAEAGVIPEEAGAAIAAACRDFAPDLAGLAAGTARDGVAVPALVAALRAAVGPAHAPHVHLGTTSQDVVDSALSLRLARALGIIEERLARLLAALDRFAADHGALQIMGRTRLQRALPISLSDRVAAWRDPLARHQARLAALRPRVLTLQLGGPVGTLDQLGAQGPEVARRLGAALGLAVPERAWHAARDGRAELAGWLSLVTGAAGKIGADVALMAQGEVGELRLTAGGASSAMAHKVNPVKAEVLVTLARFNAVQCGGLHQSLVHELERSGQAWTLEWLILPAMVVATAGALRTCDALLHEVAPVP